MRHNVAGSALGRPTAHRMLMLRGAVTDLLRNGSIKTTQAKAKEIRRLAEKTISRGKKVLCIKEDRRRHFLRMKVWLKNYLTR